MSSASEFVFVDATFRSGDMRCQVRKSRKSGPKFDAFAPQIGRGHQKILVGHF